MGFLYSSWARFWTLFPQGPGTTTFWPPASTYDPATDVPDQSGKVVLITGGATGIGYETAKQLLIKNAKVYVAGRNARKVEAAIDRLEEETGKRALALQLDLGDLPSVVLAAEEFLREEKRLDLLYCNAGVMVPPTDQLTNQSYDLQFGTNVVAHYLLARLLLPALQRSTAATGTRARLVHTTSAGYLGAPPETVNYATVVPGPARDAAIKSWGKLAAPWTLYGQSKMGNVLVANWFDRHFGADVVSSSVHPGLVHSELGRHGVGWQEWVMDRLRWPTAMGAINLLWAGTSEEGEGFGEKYIIPWARVWKWDPRAVDAAKQDELVVWLDEELKEYLQTPALAPL